MPGTFSSIFLQAFDFDETGHAVKAFEARVMRSETTVIDEAVELPQRHAGAWYGSVRGILP